MLRIGKILNQLNKTRPNYNTISTSVVSNNNITFNISNEYRYRMVQKSDYEAIKELCSTVYGGTDFLVVDFYDYLNDNTIIFLGVEYVKESKIIATELFLINDGGTTAFSFGGRMHPRFRGKGIYTKFLSWCYDMIQKLHPKTKRIRSTTFKSNAPSLAVSKNVGSNYLPNYSEYTCYHIVHSNYIKDFGEWRQNFKIYSNAFQSTLNEIDTIDIDIKCVYNVDYIIKTIINNFDINVLCLNWKIFDLTLGQKSIDDAKLYLNKTFKTKRLQIWMDYDESCLCMMYGEGQQNQFYIMSNKYTNKNTIISLMRVLFEKWVNKMIDIPSSNELYIFVQKSITNNTTMKRLCHPSDHLVVTEKIL